MKRVNKNHFNYLNLYSGPSTIVVCNYNPPGNYTGGFIENVLEIRERNEQYKVLYHSKAPTNKTMEYENNLPIEDQIFLSHNRYRSYHGCPPLVINEELTNLANQWAQVFPPDYLLNLLSFIKRMISTNPLVFNGIQCI